MNKTPFLIAMAWMSIGEAIASVGDGQYGSAIVSMALATVYASINWYLNRNKQ